MGRFSKLIGVGLAGIVGTLAPQVQAASIVLPSAEQAELLDLLEQSAKYLLQRGEHVPVVALVMRPSGEIQSIDFEQGFAHQQDALTATFERLVPMAQAKQIKASGIMYQPGDPGGEKVPVLIFDLEQVGHPRFFVMLTYARNGGKVTFGREMYGATPAKLLANQHR